MHILHLSLLLSLGSTVLGGFNCLPKGEYVDPDKHFPWGRCVGNGGDEGYSSKCVEKNPCPKDGHHPGCIPHGDGWAGC
ncbi:unnamed protein product [Zymoseptoria tritici ST99CH_3D1]|nr:unnamed protein product [Zymoseptoria tritici ST99CH_3D1]